MRRKLNIFGPVFLIVIAFTFSLMRDLKIERQYTGDLRNRVVGARMQMDGKSPYFYHWKPEDGMRYFDFGYFPDLKISLATSTPFYHQLLYPIALLNQRTVSRIWLGVQYAILSLCVLIAFFLSQNKWQYWAIAIVSACIPFTVGWIHHVATGQNYLIIPILMMAFAYVFAYARNFSGLFISGLLAIALILIKPNAVLFFVPFIILVRKYSIKQICFFLLPAVLLIGFNVSNQKVRSYWLDFFVAMKEHSSIHEQGGSFNQEPDGFYIDSLEGIRRTEVMQAKLDYPLTYHNESFGSVTIYYETGQSLSLKALKVLPLAFIGAILICFFYGNKNRLNYSFLEIVLLGCCLYMISDLFAPIVRRQYNSVQWIGALLMLAAVYKKALKSFFFFIAVGILLQMTNLSFIIMQHTLGEMILLVTILVMFYKRTLSGENLGWSTT